MHRPRIAVEGLKIYPPIMASVAEQPLADKSNSLGIADSALYTEEFCKGSLSISANENKTPNDKYRLHLYIWQERIFPFGKKRLVLFHVTF